MSNQTSKKSTKNSHNMVPSRPHTPLNLITSATPSAPSNHNQGNSLFHQLLRSPLPPAHHIHTPQTLSFDTSPSPTTPSNENIEVVINNLLIVIEDNRPIDLDQLKTVLHKCLISLSHYKLQAEIMKYNQLENTKRNEIENKLIQTQVDHLLLKSPFLPSNESNRISTPRSSITKAGIATTHKVAKPKLKMVERSLYNNLKYGANITAKSVTPQTKARNSYKNSNDFNNCIKVFHLEKSQ